MKEEKSDRIRNLSTSSSVASNDVLACVVPKHIQGEWLEQTVTRTASGYTLANEDHKLASDLPDAGRAHRQKRTFSNIRLSMYWTWKRSQTKESRSKDYHLKGLRTHGRGILWPKQMTSVAHVKFECGVLFCSVHWQPALSGPWCVPSENERRSYPLAIRLRN